ncbi:MAG: DUF1552 domain-containing protein [Bacteroidota bacterium]
MNQTRRNLLAALGLAGPAYFLPSMRGGRTARAADPAIPTRILFFYTPHGTLFRQWIRPAAGAAAATETAYELGPILQPLQPWKSKLLLMEGLDFQSGYVDPLGTPADHAGGQAHALSATNRVNASTAGGVSIDQFIAKQINTPAPITAVPSLEMSARFNAAIPGFSTSWAGASALVPAMTDPNLVYKRLFPNGPPSSTGPTPAQIAAAAAAKRRQSILDGILGEFSAVKQPLSTVDRAKLDSHAALLRDLERRIGLTSTPTATCSAPDQATVGAPYKMDCPYGAGPKCIQDSITAFTRLSVAAFACDITRVITFDIDTLASTLFGVADVHQFLHGMDDVWWYANERFGTKMAVTATAMDAANIATAIRFYASYSQILADILAQLNTVLEPDGSTLLDHTIVAWCPEVGSSNHTNYMANYVLAGGASAGLKLGRYLSMPRAKPTVAREFYPTAGLPHNNLFVSLANAMGLSTVKTFGNPSVCTGPLTQVTA